MALFKIVGEGPVSGGVRRREALTGEAARQWLTHRDDQLRAVAASLKTTPDEAPARVAVLVEQSRKLEKELADAKRALALVGSAGGGAGTAAAAPEIVDGYKFLGQSFDGLDPKGLRGMIDEAKGRLASGIAAIVAVMDGRATIAVGVTDDLTSKFSAVDLVRVGVEALGGKGGGGRPDMAQGGGPDGSAAAKAIEAVKAAIGGGEGHDGNGACRLSGTSRAIRPDDERTAFRA